MDDAGRPDGRSGRRGFLSAIGAALAMGSSGCAAIAETSDTPTETATPAPVPGTEAAETQTAAVDSLTVERAAEVLERGIRVEPAEYHQEMLQEAEQRVDTAAPTPEYLRQIRAIGRQYATTQYEPVRTGLMARNVKLIHQQLGDRAAGIEDFRTLANASQTTTLRASVSGFHPEHILIDEVPIGSSRLFTALLAVPLDDDPAYLIGPFEDEQSVQTAEYGQSVYAADHQQSQIAYTDIGSLRTAAERDGACTDERYSTTEEEVLRVMANYAAFVSVTAGQERSDRLWPRTVAAGTRVEDILETGAGHTVAITLTEFSLLLVQSDTDARYRTFAFNADDRPELYEPDATPVAAFSDIVC